MVEELTSSDLEQLSDTPTSSMTFPTINDQKVGGGLIPEYLCPFPKIVGIIPWSLAYEITQSIKTAAAAAAKSLQSCLTLCDPIDGSPPGSPVPGILQARTLEWVAISFSNA